jgi:sugar lactone lactonase YvrE
MIGEIMFQVEHFLATKNELGEGPLWSNKEGALYWVDIEGEKFHRYTVSADKIDTFSVGQPIGCLAFREKGGLIMALRDGIGYWDWSSQEIELIVNSEDDRQGVRFNDGKVDSQGRFWAGTLGVDDQNKLYRLDPDLSIQVMETGITISNGIGWSPDDKIMYYTDSPLRVIYAYDFDRDTGSIENRREFVRAPLSEGFPDGLAVDSQGFIWSAQWDGWKVVRYDPDGNIERTIPVPVQRPTSCAFGGPNLDQLFITSARTGLSETEQREQILAGDLFFIQLDIEGQPVNEFLG